MFVFFFSALLVSDIQNKEAFLCPITKNRPVMCRVGFVLQLSFSTSSLPCKTTFTAETACLYCFSHTFVSSGHYPKPTEPSRNLTSFHLAWFSKFTLQNHYVLTGMKQHFNIWHSCLLPKVGLACHQLYRLAHLTVIIIQHGQWSWITTFMFGQIQNKVLNDNIFLFSKSRIVCTSPTQGP